MTQETVIYLTNIVIVTILAGLLTHHWVSQGRSEAMRWWVVSVWVLLVADILFAARPLLPDWVARVVATILVTVGHAVLFFAARRSAERELRTGLIAGIIMVHAIALACFLAFAPQSDWRKVVNGFVWAGLSLAAYAALRRAPDVFWKPVTAPANAFLAHGIFHCVRLGLGTVFAVRGWDGASSWLQVTGDLEVSFFMVALFVSILVANLQQRNTDLTAALADVHTLSGLLPICAWCKNVRDDDGYWKRVEDFFAAHSSIQFTHGICNECFKKLNSRKHG